MEEYKMSPQEEQDFINAMRSWDKYKRKRAMKALFEKDSFSSDIEYFRFYKLAFCWFKTFVCLLFNWTHGSYLGNDVHCILTYDEGSYGEAGTSWDACWISSKFFSGWNVCLASDGT